MLQRINERTQGRRKVGNQLGQIRRFTKSTMGTSLKGATVCHINHPSPHYCTHSSLCPTSSSSFTLVFLFLFLLIPTDCFPSLNRCAGIPFFSNTCLPQPLPLLPFPFLSLLRLLLPFLKGAQGPHLLANMSGRVFFSQISACCTLSHMVSLFFFSFCSLLIPPPPLLSQVHRD